MEIGVIGMGKMGIGIALRLARGGHEVAVYDKDSEKSQEAEEHGIDIAESVEELAGSLSSPKVVWIMVPQGKAVEETINTLSGYLGQGDIIIDGGNSYYKESIERAERLKEKGIYFLDVGTSGGIWGEEEGYCLMVGGNIAAFSIADPLFRTLAPKMDKGYGYVGTSGAGHFVKMVHNGIEYGLMQAYAEGFELLRAKEEFDFDLSDISEIWREGSVIRSWLLDLTALALKEDSELEGIEAYVEDSGEGRWAVKEGVDLAVPLPVISQSLQNRFASRDKNSYASKLLSAMRAQFGGHSVKRKE